RDWRGDFGRIAGGSFLTEIDTSCRTDPARTRAGRDRSAKPHPSVSLRAGNAGDYIEAVIQEDSMKPLAPVVHSDPEILGGTPVFVGTRVPVQSLFDYLEGGETLDEFLHQFPSVTREQAVAALELARDALVTGARPA